MAKAQVKKETKQQSSKGSDKLSGEVVPATVKELIGRTGFRGEITQVKCKILQGKKRISKEVLMYARVSRQYLLKKYYLKLKLLNLINQSHL